MSRQRENNLDLLRVICTIAVIALHAGSGYADEYLAGEPKYYFIIGNIFHTLTRFAVPCFIMLSGAFLLSDERNMNYSWFYKKSYRQLGVPLLWLSMLYVVYTYCVYGVQVSYQGAEVDWLKPLWQWGMGIPFFHLWYMYMLVGLYLMVPVLIRIKQHLTTYQYKLMAGIILLGGIIANNIYIPNMPYWLMSFYYIGYLLWGDILHSAVEYRGSLVVGLVCLVAILYIKQVQVLEDSTYISWVGNVLDPLNILAALAALSIFSWFCRLRCCQSFSNLAGLTYYMYLIHALWLHILWHVIKLTGCKGNPAVVLPGLICIVALLAWGSSKLYVTYFKKV